MKTTALIILNYNNVEDTINCIESVERYNTAPVKYVVVDNGSPRSDAVAVLDRYMHERFGCGYSRISDRFVNPTVMPRATLLASGSNDGYAVGNNKGLRLVQHDPDIADVMILNNDILFVEDIIPQLKRLRESLPHCGLISPLLLKRDGCDIDYNCARRQAGVGELVSDNFLHYFKRLRGDEDGIPARCLIGDSEEDLPQYMEIDLPSGSCMMIDKETFAKIGFFDPGTFLYYEEDILHKKLAAMGLSNYLIPSLRCIHLGACSTGRKGTPLTLRAGRDSQRYYVKHYSGASAPMRLLYLLSSKFYWMTLRVQKKLFPSGLSDQQG